MTGNFDDDQTNDWTLPDSEVLEWSDSFNERQLVAKTFGDAWIENPSTCSQTNYSPVQECSLQELQVIESANYCGRLYLEPFSHCQEEREFLYDSCVYDLCAHKPSEYDDLICESLSAMTRQCNVAGKQIDSWRTPDFCPRACPANQIFEPYTNTATVSTWNCQGAPPAIVPYDESCVCPPDLPYWNGHVCVATCPAVPNEPQLPVEVCFGSAIGMGDTHYFSFDGLQTDFQGHCIYTASQLCDEQDSSEETPYYHIAVDQLPKDPRKGYVTYIHGWTFTYIVPGTGQKLTIRQDNFANQGHPEISVDGGNFVNVMANYDYSDFGIKTEGYMANTIYFGYASDTDFKIKWVWSIEHRVMLSLNCLYQNKVCGLMGTYNGDPSDDWMGPDGQLIPRPGGENYPANQDLWTETFTFGDAWLYSPEECPADDQWRNAQFDCTEEEWEETKSNQWCGRFENTPFAACDHLSKQYKISCRYDLCLVGRENWEQALCDVLSSFSDSCANVGQSINNWRASVTRPDGSMMCPITCPSNLVYNERASSCVDTTYTCETETCEADNQISQTCTCLPGQVYNPVTLVCEDTCPVVPVDPVIPDEKCVGVALGAGDTHYVTFDQYYFDYQGQCEYLFSGVCPEAKLPEYYPWYNLFVTQKYKAGSTEVSYIYAWRFEYLTYGSNTLISIDYDRDVNDGQPIIIVGTQEETLAFPGFYPELGLATTSDGQILLGVTSKSTMWDEYVIALNYNNDHFLQISVDCMYQNLLCGFAGNFDGDDTNDLVDLEGNIMAINKFGSNADKQEFSYVKASYEYAAFYKTENATCTSPVTPITPCEDQALLESADWCGRLAFAPFTSCGVNVNFNIENCVLDVCSVAPENRQQELCNFLTGYEKDCNALSKYIPEWRSQSFCPYVCPSNQVYADDAQKECQMNTENCQNDFSDCLAPVKPGCRCPDELPIWDGYNQICTDLCQNMTPRPVICESNYAMSLGKTFMSFDQTYQTLDSTCDLLLAQTVNSVSAESNMLGFTLWFNTNARKFTLQLDQNNSTISIGHDQLYQTDFESSYNAWNSDVQFVRTFSEDFKEKHFTILVSGQPMIILGYQLKTQDIFIKLDCQYRDLVEGIFGNFNENSQDEGLNTNLQYSGLGCKVTQPTCDANTADQCATIFATIYLSDKINNINWRSYYQDLFAEACQCQADLCQLFYSYNHMMYSSLKDSISDESYHLYAGLVDQQNHYLEMENLYCQVDSCALGSEFLLEGPGICYLDEFNCDQELECLNNLKVENMGCYWEGF